jgi:hypothetical protein
MLLQDPSYTKKENIDGKINQTEERKKNDPGPARSILRLPKGQMRPTSNFWRQDALVHPILTKKGRERIHETRSTEEKWATLDNVLGIDGALPLVEGVLAALAIQDVLEIRLEDCC